MNDAVFYLCFINRPPLCFAYKLQETVILFIFKQLHCSRDCE